MTAFWATAGDIATAIGVPVALIALLIHFRDHRRAKRIAYGDFLLRIEEASFHHDEIYLTMRTGDWSDNGDGPQTDAEWIAVENYMGFFEHCEFLIQNGTLEESAFIELFAYRMEFIAENAVITNELLSGPSRQNWTLFIRCAARCGYEL